MPTENGCPAFKGRRPLEDAACVTALRRAGAVILGKTVTTELAAHTPPRTRNPRNLEHTPGGSSSGSAAAVAAGMVPAALGTQTGGSVIRPAAFCGVYGFKPTFGIIPRTGVLTQAPSLDTVGVMGRSVEDVALLADALQAYDDRDPASLVDQPPAPARHRHRGLAARRRCSPSSRRTPGRMPTPSRTRPSASWSRRSAARSRRSPSTTRPSAASPPRRPCSASSWPFHFGPLLDRAPEHDQQALAARIEEGRRVRRRLRGRAQRARAALCRRRGGSLRDHGTILTPAAPGRRRRAWLHRQPRVLPLLDLPRRARRHAAAAARPTACRWACSSSAPAATTAACCARRAGWCGTWQRRLIEARPDASRLSPAACR